VFYRPCAHFSFRKHILILYDALKKLRDESDVKGKVSEFTSKFKSEGNNGEKLMSLQAHQLFSYSDHS
jgi:hypothetical protein